MTVNKYHLNVLLSMSVKKNVAHVYLGVSITSMLHVTALTVSTTAMYVGSSKFKSRPADWLV